MKRIAILTILGVAFAAAQATAQMPAQGWAEKMFKDGLIHDFGSQPRGAQLTHTFTITNIYAVEMQITQITSGCGCVSAEAKKRTLAPRESTTIDVKMDTKRFTGPKTVGVRVTVGPNFISSAELQVKAISRTDLVFNPNQISFGVVSRGQRPTQFLDIEYAGALAWQIEGVITNDVPYDVTYVQNYRQPGKVGYRLTVTMKSEAPVGVHRHNVYLKTNDPSSPVVPVLIESAIQSAVTVTPDTLSLGSVKVGTSLLRRVVVRGNQPFRVLGVTGMGQGVTLGGVLSNRDEPQQIVTFRVEPKSEGLFRHQIELKTTLQQAPVTVTIEGIATR